jgi:hypothetical protein
MLSKAFYKSNVKINIYIRNEGMKRKKKMNNMHVLIGYEINIKSLFIE